MRAQAVALLQAVTGCYASRGLLPFPPLLKPPRDSGRMIQCFRRAVLLGIFCLPGHAVAQAPVEVARAEDQAVLQQVAFAGTVTSPRQAVLSTSVAGLVDRVVLDEGARVAAGEALIELDPELIALSLERVRAERAQAETGLADARRRLRDAETIGTSRAIARTEIESLRAEVESDTAVLAAAVAAVREQEALLERHVVRAPFAGVISRRIVETGEWANPGDDLLELVATEGLQFDFRVAQEYFAALATDAQIDISLDAVPDTVLEGRIAAIVPVSSPGARSFLVRALVSAEAERGVTPGMSASGTFSIGTGRIAVTVSRDAILRFPDGRTTVWIVDDTGELPVVRERVVRTGVEFGNDVEILDGLASGSRVVTRGNETLREGQTVRIIEGSGA